MNKTGWGFFIGLSLSACATTHLPPVGSEPFVPEEDEKRIWTRSEEEQKVLDNGGLIYQDNELHRYLNTIARKLEPPSIYQHIPFKIVVLKSPYLNAFTFPNGIIYVHTGILARMENEAQLATLLAHEMSHAVHRHTVREFRSTKNKTAALASLQFSVGHVPLVGDLASLLGGIGATGAVTGYSRSMETEADTEGFKRVVQAGYDPRETPKLFGHLKKEIEEEGGKEPFFFGTHPRLKERMDNYNSLIRDVPPGKKTWVKNEDVFLQKTRKLILDNAVLDLQAGRFQTARRGVEKYLHLRPKDSRPHYLMGEILRQKDEKGDLASAKKHYQEAIALDPGYADAHKGIGLVYFRMGDNAQAKKSFRSYLGLAPSASDRGYIENTIKQLD